MSKQLAVHIDIAQSVQALDGGLTQTIDDLVVLGSAHGLFETNEGVGLQEPQVRAFWALSQEVAEQSSGIGITLLLEEGTGEAHLPVERLRVEQVRHAVGGLGRHVHLEVRVGVAQKPVHRRIASTELDDARQGNLRFLPLRLPHMNDGQVLPCTAELRMLVRGRLVVRNRFGELLLLEVQVRQREVVHRAHQRCRQRL